MRHQTGPLLLVAGVVLGTGLFAQAASNVNGTSSPIPSRMPASAEPQESAPLVRHML